MDGLEPPDVARDPRVQVWLEGVRLLVRPLGREVLIRGNCDRAPFSLASMARGAADWMMDLMDGRLGLPYALHICGWTDRILDDMVATGADDLELDHKTDARLARERMGGQATFIGNLDPSGVLALGTPELVEAKTRELLEVFADTPQFILNAGCAIPATTPPENLRAMIRAARG